MPVLQTVCQGYLVWLIRIDSVRCNLAESISENHVSSITNVSARSDLILMSRQIQLVCLRKMSTNLKEKAKSQPPGNCCPKRYFSKKCGLGTFAGIGWPLSKCYFVAVLTKNVVTANNATTASFQQPDLEFYTINHAEIEPVLLKFNELIIRKSI